MAAPDSDGVLSCAARHGGNPVGASIAQAVRALYELRPYPHYPLLAKARWQEGYLGSAYFAQALYGDRTGLPAASILIGGAGEMLPYIFRRWHARSLSLINVDLSARSLRRARWRLGLDPGGSQLVQADLDSWLACCPAGTLGHADLFGVLHHVANPTAMLSSLARCLAPDATARIMVYNTPARSWIEDCAAIFRLLGLNASSGYAVRCAQELLAAIAALLPRVQERLQAMGPSLCQHPSRFADAFLHPRVVQTGISAWWHSLKSSGFQIVGLFDRYAELDDLPNPLWQAPTPESLEERAADGRFEGNLELFLRKPAAPCAAARGAWPARSQLGWRHYAAPPPLAWLSYDETRHIPIRQHYLLWWRFLTTLAGKEQVPSAWSLPKPAVQRLARIGALLPGMLSAEQRVLAAAKMTARMDPPPRAIAATDHALEQALTLMREYSRRHHRPWTERLQAAITARLRRLGAP